MNICTCPRPGCGGSLARFDGARYAPGDFVSWVDAAGLVGSSVYVVSAVVLDTPSGVPLYLVQGGRVWIYEDELVAVPAHAEVLMEVAR